MCVDYTDLNKHCPKDHFGLPRIDQVVDSTAGCVLLYFLDCYSGYHHIALKEEDQIKTVFITPFGMYAYKTISFGLKNAGATYQRAIQMCFADQLPSLCRRRPPSLTIAAALPAPFSTLVASTRHLQAGHHSSSSPLVLFQARATPPRLCPSAARPPRCAVDRQQ
jgi:hypothetical protein